MIRVTEESAFDRALQTLFSHIVVSPTAQQFTTDDGVNHVIKNSPVWKKSLGKEMCIMDIDNRQFDEEGQTWGPGAFIWENQKNQAAGLLNHYLYGKIELVQERSEC
jgi:hypothetical protein